MQQQFGPAELRALFDGQKLSLIYGEALKLSNDLRIHADGEVPIRLIKKARPNESEAVQKYREEIYEAETQNPIERVVSLLEKIRRSPDWMMRFDNEIPKIIRREETLEAYLTKNYPVYQDIEYWLFEEVLRTLALDANAVIAVIPMEFSISAVDYIKPIARVFNSRNVIDFVADEYAVLKTDELSSLMNPTEQQQHLSALSAVKNIASEDAFTAGQVYYVINTSMYQKWERTSEGKYQLTAQFNHNLGRLPAFQVPGKFVKRVGKYTLKKTPLYAMLPHLNKAARESNDLDAGVVMHLFLQKWIINNNECKPCHGTGVTPSPNGPTNCKTCGGTGMATGKSPFNELHIKAQALGEKGVPIPPAGYVELNPEILRLQSERVEAHIYRALAAVNMEHLADVQLNQSGTAKEYDRDDLNNMIYTFATMLSNVANSTVSLICDLRYQGIIPNAQEREKLLPVIPVPEKFDVINSSFLITEYQSAKTAGLNSIILAEMQKEISQKKFYANPDVAAFVGTVMELDPFPDKTVEEKGLMESQGLATKTDVILSNYISEFVRRAQREHPNFHEFKGEEKRKILAAYAEEKAQLIGAAKQIKSDVIEDVES